MAECATTTAPAKWDDPEAGSIDLFVKRYPAVTQPAKAQLWLLDGGPGMSGVPFEHWAFWWRSRIPDIDIYIPDHRGTGKSSFATADTQNLEAFTTTNAAKDVAALIDATREPSQQVFVFGVSYGSYWAQRYLQVRPEQPTGTILDSTVPAVGMDFTRFDQQADANARAVLALCQADTTCSAKLGPDPVAKGFEALAAAEAGTCPTFFNRMTFGFFVGSNYFERLLLPASIYRMLRCNDADQAWFDKVIDYQFAPTPGDPGNSDAVFKNIIYSELWLTPKTEEQLWAESRTLLATFGMVGHPTAESTWPKYPRDEYFGSWPFSPKPTLVLQGTLDPRTPFADVVKPHYSGPQQYFVELPLANHGVHVDQNAPMVDLEAYGCGWRIIESFLADPTKAPDTSCVAGMAPLDFGNPPAAWLAQVGIQNLWENP